jgi:colicin import membrane protein
VSAEALDYRNRREPALGRSFLLALAVHAVLVAVIFTGVRWQTSRPETITLELWEAPPPPPPPAVEAPKPPPQPPKVAPEPPKPEPPKPEPKIEKPQIVEKAPPPKPKPEAKPKPKPEPKPKPKPEPKPKADPEFEKRMREEAAAEQKQIDDQNRAREAREIAQRLATAAQQSALQAWTDKIAAKIRGNIVLPPDLAGNPEAIFDVALLPDGSVLTVRRRKSSGHAGYDAAVERAIYKSSPLPKPDQPSAFRRDLELRFRPKDQ